MRFFDRIPKWLICNKLGTPCALIISSSIIALAGLISSGALKATPKVCATVIFEGGIQKIGLLKKELIITEGTFELEKNRATYKSVEDQIIDFERVIGGMDASKPSFQSGSVIRASASVHWVGSEGEYTLPLDTITLISTKTHPLEAKEVIDRLKEFQNKSLSELASISNKHLRFTELQNQLCTAWKN
jgi:hypothetical protein